MTESYYPMHANRDSTPKCLMCGGSRKARDTCGNLLPCPSCTDGRARSDQEDDVDRMVAQIEAEADYKHSMFLEACDQRDQVREALVAMTKDRNLHFENLKIARSERDELQAEVKRLRELMRLSHPRCPDDPCPAVFPYCEELAAKDQTEALLRSCPEIETLDLSREVKDILQSIRKNITEEAKTQVNELWSALDKLLNTPVGTSDDRCIAIATAECVRDKFKQIKEEDNDKVA